MSGASPSHVRQRAVAADGSRDRPLTLATHPAPPEDRRRANPNSGVEERCANFGDIAAREDMDPRSDVGSRVPSLPSNGSRNDASWSRRFVVTAHTRATRIVCGHAGLNARTALDEALRSRVRAMLLDFSRAPFGRGCVDRNHEGPLAPAIDRENFVLAATTSAGGIKAGTVRSNTIPRGRSAGTFPSRARDVVRHSRESDPGGSGISAEPSRPDFSREGRRSSEDPGSKDQGGPK